MSNAPVPDSSSPGKNQKTPSGARPAEGAISIGWWTLAAGLALAVLIVMLTPAARGTAPAGAASAEPVSTTWPCLSYAPFRRPGHAPFDPALRLTREQIVEDLNLIRPLSPCVRLYGVGHGLEQVPDVARSIGMKVVLGAWIDRDEPASQRELETALRLAREHADVVRMIVVGNEVLLRQERTPEQLAALLTRARQQSAVPVAYADVWEFWLRHAAVLAPAVDVVGIHILPYWEDHPVGHQQAVEHVVSIHDKVRQQLSPLPVWVAETGWPALGRQRGPAVPGPRQQAQILRELQSRATPAGVDYNVIEAFDQPWKRHLEGAMGGYWGVMDPQGRVRDDSGPAGWPIDRSALWALVGMALGLLLGAGWGWTRRPSWAADLAALHALCTALVAAGLAHHLSTLNAWCRTPLEWGVALAMVTAFGAFMGVQLFWPAGRWRLQTAALVALSLLLLPLVFDGRYRPLPWSLVAAVAVAAVFGMLGRRRLWGSPAHRDAAVDIAHGRPDRLQPENLTLCVLIACSSVAVVAIEGVANTQALALAAGAAVTAFVSYRNMVQADRSDATAAR